MLVRRLPVPPRAVTLDPAITGIGYALLLSEVDVHLSSLLALVVMWIGRQRLAAQSRSPAARTMSKRT